MVHVAIGSRTVLGRPRGAAVREPGGHPAGVLFDDGHSADEPLVHSSGHRGIVQGEP